MLVIIGFMAIGTITDKCTRYQLLKWEVALSRFDDHVKISKGKGRNMRMEKRI